MEPIYTTKIIKIKNEKMFEADDTLVREIKFEIFVNDKRVGALMTTPVDTDALSVGYLMSENIVEKVEDISSLEHINDGMGINIKAKINKNSLNKLNAEGVVISGCGRATTSNIDPESIEAAKIQNNFKISAKTLLKQMSQFYTECPLYEQTGCVHTAKLFVNEERFFIGEDIAQHNTIDKAIGKAKLQNEDISNAFLMVSGRLSSEMVAKAIMHQIPILVSRTATTCLGLMIARKFNLTLAGFAREDRMNVYSGEERIYV